MSVRYGIDLVLQPSFTAKVYQTRQIVCGQYSSWAAEMQPLRMPLTPYFPCPDDRLPVLASEIEGIAGETGDEKPFFLQRREIEADSSMNGVILRFEESPRLLALQQRCNSAARSQSLGLYPDWAFSPRIALLEYGAFPEAILPDAAEFAEGVASGLDMTEMALPWRLLLTRYSSDAAGDDWSNGRWAADLSWQQLASHPLYSGEMSLAEMLDLVKERGK